MPSDPGQNAETQTGGKNNQWCTEEGVTNRTIDSSDADVIFKQPPEADTSDLIDVRRQSEK